MELSRQPPVSPKGAGPDQSLSSPGLLVDYLTSMPERLVRAAAASGGGLLLEGTELIIPSPVRRHSKLYQATVARILSITVEFVGGVTGRYPAEEMEAQELVVRKLAGNAMELASVAAVGFSPLWALAAASDVIGGTRAFLDSFVKEIKDKGILPEDSSVSSVDELLAALEGTSGQVADTIDIPPVAVDQMRDTVSRFRQNAENVPAPRRLAGIFSELHKAAREQDRSLLTISSLLAAGAVHAGIRVGDAHVFSYYGDSLATIRKEGVPAYLKRISKPYLVAAAHHIHSGNPTHTQRLIRRVLRSLETLDIDAGHWSTLR